MADEQCVVFQKDIGLYTAKATGQRVEQGPLVIIVIVRMGADEWGWRSSSKSKFTKSDEADKNANVDHPGNIQREGWSHK